MKDDATHSVVVVANAEGQLLQDRVRQRPFYAVRNRIPITFGRLVAVNFWDNNTVSHGRLCSTFENESLSDIGWRQSMCASRPSPKAYGSEHSPPAAS